MGLGRGSGIGAPEPPLEERAGLGCAHSGGGVRQMIRPDDSSYGKLYSALSAISLAINEQPSVIPSDQASR